jgi:hypothetical protein
MSGIKLKRDMCMLQLMNSKIANKEMTNKIEEIKDRLPLETILDGKDKAKWDYKK